MGMEGGENERGNDEMMKGRGEDIEHTGFLEVFSSTTVMVAIFFFIRFIFHNSSVSFDIPSIVALLF